MWASANLTVRLFALVAIAVLPALGVEVYGQIETQNMRVHESEEQALRLVRLVAGELSQTIEGARQLLTALGQTPYVQTGEAKACSAFFVNLARAYSHTPCLPAVISMGVSFAPAKGLQTSKIFSNRRCTSVRSR